jgi:hypothetical protein
MARPVLFKKKHFVVEQGVVKKRHTLLTRVEICVAAVWQHTILYVAAERQHTILFVLQSVNIQY